MQKTKKDSKEILVLKDLIQKNKVESRNIEKQILTLHTKKDMLNEAILDLENAIYIIEASQSKKRKPNNPDGVSV